MNFVFLVEGEKVKEVHCYFLAHTKSHQYSELRN